MALLGDILRFGGVGSFGPFGGLFQNTPKTGIGSRIEQGISSVGRRLNLPEMGISELFGKAYASGPTSTQGNEPPPSDQGLVGPAGVVKYQAPTNTGGGQQQQQQQQSNPEAEARAAAERAAQEAYNAENQSLNTQFDYTKAQLEGQLPGLANQRDTSLGQVDLGIADVNRQVGASKTNLGTSTQQQINQAGSTARNVQGQNRNVLRSLGILNSSAAGQILAKPMNQFDEQRAQLGQFLVQKTTELDDFVNQKVAEASATKNQILQSYNDLVSKIQTDLRFNDRQRNDAIKQANAALSQHMATISQSVMQYQQQAALQKQQFQAAMAQALNYQNPTYNQGAITSLGLVNPQQQAQQGQSAAIYEDPRKKQLGSY